MPRPTKSRKVEYIPEITYFKPRGVPLRDLDENIITVEELEAMRLKDIENLDQQECADKMEISRATFQNVLISARKKITDALVFGKAIRIEGGNYQFTDNAGYKRRFRHCSSKQKDNEEAE